MAKLSTYPKSNDFTGAYLSGIDANSNVTNYNPLFLPISTPTQNALNALTASIGMEATTRGNNDTQLQTNLNTETSDREAADDHLQDQINDITSGYLTTSTADSTYLKKTDAASTYQTQSGMAAYLTIASAASTYLTQTSAAATYQTQSGMSAFMPKSGGTFTGAVSGLTASAGTNDTTLATTAFVTTAVTNGVGTVTKASLGLGNVDNTSDVNKPVSTAQQTALNLKVDKSSIGAANGIVPLGSDSKIPAAYIPGSIDEIDEFANLAAFPATGATNKLYVALDTEKVYRWGGSSYVEISPSPGSTDAVPEGSSNLYFTNARAVAALSSTLSGYLTTSAASSTYQTISGMSSYLTTSAASSTYLTQSSAAATYLTQSSASSTYATNANLGNYMPKSGGTFTGGVTVPGGFTVQGGAGDQGGAINLGASPNGGLNSPQLYQFQGKFLFYEAGGSGRGAYLDWSNLSSWSNNKILTSSDLNSYATQSFVTSQGYITSSALSGYATQSFVTSQGYITSSALSGYMPRSGGTFTGVVSTNGSGTGNSVIGNASGGLGDIVVSNNGVGGGAAMMQFIRQGQYAGYFGIDTDNVWKVGGYSMGSNAYTIWHAGNFNPGSYQPAGNYQSALGFTPVRQGGGANQGSNTVYLGWDGGGLRAQVDSTDFGQLAFRSDLGSYATQSFVTGQGYITSSALSGYATQSYVQSYVAANSGGLKYSVSAGTSFTMTAGTVWIDSNNTLGRSVTLTFPTGSDGQVVGYCAAAADISGLSAPGSFTGANSSQPTTTILNDNKVHMWVWANSGWNLIQ